MMPEVDGMAVLEAVRCARPELLPRFALMTGGAYSDEARAVFEPLHIRVLQKPFDVAELERLVAATRRRS